MFTRHTLRQLLVAITVLSVAQATWLGGSEPDARALVKRQNAVVIGPAGSSAASAKADSQSTPSANESTPSAVATVPSTPSSASTPTSTPSASPSSTASPSSSARVTPPSTPTPSPSPVPVPSASSSAAASSAAVQPPSSSQSPANQQSTLPISRTATGAIPAPSESSATPSLTTKVEVVTATRSDGSKETMTSTTVSTSTPGLNSDNGEATGMTPKTRNTVIGVVVGVGGAIVLGTLALVAWRIWGRKKYNEEHDVLMDYDMSASGPEKSERGNSVGGRTPFQSTLENYHQPGHVNPSSNF
ncbi:Mid2-like cell wall stress sensor [Moelleriella libera RCEF 2490]|uniref:Mid2-like cell wall stress sensor n=1 Tax=Moelleriella libera RCEF 2490 TaxID=1081109 RepID=A0A168ETN6_9HYPO|nr:Mid2-like cell wall stress sensor [Moelleriella libera RCEF 2490]